MDFLSHITLFGFFFCLTCIIWVSAFVFLWVVSVGVSFVFSFFILIFFVLGFVLLLSLLFACLLSKEKERKDTLEEPGKKKP